MKVAKNFPEAKYDVCGDILNKKRKSNLPKSKRSFLADDIENWLSKYPIPAPNAFTPNHEQIMKRR